MPSGKCFISRFYFTFLPVLCLVWTNHATHAADLETTKPAIKVLFLGDNGHHQPRARFGQLQPVLSRHGINLTYSDQVSDLNPTNLASFDALLIYANLEVLPPEQEKALLSFVESGKGFIPLHCASYCFLNSPRYIALVGAQFQKHGTGIVGTSLSHREHPILQGFGGFESWDETYTHHHHHEEGRTVLEYRNEEMHREPWTWVRNQGQGRVFYTAWGHDARTWSHPGFQNLVERGIRWAVGRDPGIVSPYSDKPEMSARRTDVRPFEFVPAKVPFYPAGKKWGTLSEPISQMQKPLTPEESLKHLVAPVGFEPRLFASEPDIGKPLAMTWDERGRLWLAETVDYPNELKPSGQGRDRIRICEDTNGDGRADKFTIFAERLSIPTSLLCVRGGLIVAQAPHMLFLKDTNGDDVADERQILFTGWGTSDTHSGPSNLRYGLDNWIYGIVGYSGFNGTVGGEQLTFKQGFFRFQPDGAKLEFLRNTNNNSWGVGFSEEGLLFGSTANGNPSEFLPIPNRYYEAVRGWSSTVLTGIADSNRFDPITNQVRQVDWHGGFTAAAGHALYTARTYPHEYWNRTAFVAEPTGHLIATFVIRSEGAGFRSRNSWNLIAGDDEWIAPIAAEVGPDGNVWFIDWYNFIVQHNPTPAGFKNGAGNAYETDLRDKTHGRIYRLVYKDAPPSKQSLHHAPTDQLVATLRNENMFWRLHAQRLLVEQNRQDAIPRLIDQLQDKSVDRIGLKPAVIHALWTLQGLGALKGSNSAAQTAVAQCCNHPSAGVRRNAIQLLPINSPTHRALVEEPLNPNEDPQVRLAALLALADAPAADSSAQASLRTLLQNLAEKDRWINDAATAAGARSSRAFLIAAAQGKQPELSNPAILERLTIVASHESRETTSESLISLLSVLRQSQPVVSEAILLGFDKSWPRDRSLTFTPNQGNTLIDLFRRSTPSARSHLMNLVARWNTPVLEPFLTEQLTLLANTLQDEKQPDVARLAAATQWVEFRRSDITPIQTILQLITPRTSPDLSRGLIEALARSEAKETGHSLVEKLGSVSPKTRAAAIRILLNRGDWTQSLLQGIEQGKLPLSELSLDQKQSLAAHPDKTLAKRAQTLLSQGGGLPDPDRQKVIEALLPVVKQQGQPAHGKELFKKHCAKCHIHSGEGNRIGPDLTGMAVHPKEELLIHLIDPSRSVEGNYRVYSVVTTQGRVFNGLLASENKTALELFDSEGKTQVIQREDIDELVASSKSLMPDGFEKQLSAKELVDLLEFLTQRGKYLPLDLHKAATIVSTRGMFYDEQADTERLIFSDWSPKTFAGVPFQLVDPQGNRTPNCILLNGPHGAVSQRMPKSVRLPCNAPCKAVHILGGISGWGFPLGEKGSVSLIARFHYLDGGTEDHPLRNGEELADYIRRVDVPGSQFAFALRGQQLRYLALFPKRNALVKEIEFLKGPDQTAPAIMAVTLESP